MKSTDKSDPQVLEQNVTKMLEAGGEAPRIADIARAKIRAQLVEKFGKEGAKKRSPLIPIGFGLAATAAGALIVTRVTGGGGDETITTPETPDGATWIANTGATVTKVGPRRIRVDGAALIDVEPGKGTYTVETARGTIEVVGTRFLVDATADRTTTAVVRGSVKLASADGNVLLHAGEQAVAEPGRPPTRGPAPRLSHLVSWAAQARKQQEHDVRPLRNGTLFAREPNQPWVPETPLPIAKLGVDIVVENQVARVAMDQTFHNPNPRVMEGMYRFAIPSDASLQRLAMYVDGVLTESAVVERMQARRIYEEIVYRRLDPALLEWAGTGRLSLKVYPLPAQEDKRLLVAYTQSLPKLYDDWTVTVPFPEIDLPVGELAFDIKIKGCANCEVTSPSHKLDVKRTGEDAIATYRQSSVRIGDSLVLRVRDARKQATTATHTENGQEYVMVRTRPEMPGAPREYRPRTWVILDDVSASRDATARRAQHDLIDGFLRELDEDDKVAIIAFDVAARQKLAPTRVLDVDRKKIRAALSEEGGIGATDLGTAFEAATKLLGNTPAADSVIVYLGDGVLSAGPRELDKLREKLAGKAQFIGVGVGDGPDTQTLESLAAATGGYATTIDLADDVGWRAFDLIAALHTPRVTKLTAQLVDANGSLVPAAVYLRTPQLADGEQLELVARLSGGDPTQKKVPVAAEITGILDGKPWKQRVALDAASTSAGYLPRLWAQRHISSRMLVKHEPVAAPPCEAPKARAAVGRHQPPIQALTCKTEREAREERDEAIRKEVVALGKQFFLLSRHTSLLVLENDAMYKQYNVVKGAGDTWAPYSVPAKIPVVKKTFVATTIAPDAELVRRPLQVFYKQQGYGYDQYDYDMDGRFFEARLRRTNELSAREGDFVTTRGQTGLGPTFTTEAQHGQDKSPDSSVATPPVGGAAAPRAEDAEDDRKQATRDVVFADEIGGLGNMRLDEGAMGRVGGEGLRVGKSSPKGGWDRPMNLSYPIRLGYPTDAAYDDLTAFIPAFSPDGAEGWRKELTMSAGGAKTHAIDDGARALLDAARRALPAGLYRWGELEIAVDSARRFGWRRTTGADLTETVSFDGTNLTRRYAELGLDVTRTFGDTDIALAMAYLPIWIADPAHYARWFEVKLKGSHKVALSRTVGKKTELAYVLEFDDKHRLVSIANAAGTQLLAVSWSSLGPATLKVAGEEVAIGFTPVPLPDATAWAHGTTTPGVVVEMPMRLPAFWTDKLKTLPEGGAEWRHAQRQRMASFAAVNDRTSLFTAYDALRTHGGVELGDLALASGGVATGTTDPQFESALAPPTVAQSSIATYLRAARSYTQSPRSDRMKAKLTNGFVGALWTLREVVALYTADKDAQAVERLLSLGDRAFELRLVGASATNNRHRMKPADVARAWDAVARGEYKNVARAQAAQVLANRAQYDAAADRIAQLVDDLDVNVAPPTLGSLYYYFQQSRRGNAGWQLVWAKWRDRVVASSSFEHVWSLLPIARSHPNDLPLLLGRAAELAGSDTDRVLAVAKFAMSSGHAALGHSLIEPLVKTNPTRELLHIVAQQALSQGRTADALGHFEAAQALGADERVSLSTVRSELGQIIGVARQLALQTTGTARKQAVDRALAWSKKWKVIDPANTQIDQTIGQLMLAVGDKAEAWRYLSSVIERDPMSGDGYVAVASAFEAQGRVAESLEFWHQAVILDQTNPTPRLRHAQALIALGRTAEGDKILDEIVNRKWHERWDGTMYTVRSMIERAKQQQGATEP